MILSNKRYEIELWDMSGHMLADISHMARDREFTLERNEAETLQFSLDLNELQAFARSINTHPRNLIQVYQTDVKVKRDGQYLFGTQIVDMPVTLGEESSTIAVTCKGYLNLFKDRYITKNYVATDAAMIARDMVTYVQGLPYGDVGVLMLPFPYLTNKFRDRTYGLSNVKTSLQNLTELIDGRFDFAFTWDKKFQTYERLGAVRADLPLTYGGVGSNIRSVVVPRSGTSLFNRVIGLGSGFGDDQLRSTKDDVQSQMAYYLREDIKQFNSVEIQTTLDQNTLAALALEKDILEIPEVVVTSAVFEGKPFVSIGDRFPLAILGHPLLDDIAGQYQVEQLTVRLDENDFEQITLKFDNYRELA